MELFLIVIICLVIILVLFSSSSTNQKKFLRVLLREAFAKGFEAGIDWEHGTLLGSDNISNIDKAEQDAYEKWLKSSIVIK